MNLKQFKSNIKEKECPICNKKLRYKAKCCGEKAGYLKCQCGYKEVA